MLNDILFILLIFLSNIVQAITGFAGTVLAMPLSLRLEGAEVAKPVLNAIAWLLCLYIAVRYYKSIRWIELLKMILFVGIGFGIGYFLESLSLPQAGLMKGYGLVIVYLAMFYLFSGFQKQKPPSWVLYLSLILGGILHKLFVSGGPLVVIYATYLFQDKDSFRSTLSLMWVALNGIMIGQHLYQGLFTSRVWVLLAISVGVTLLSYVVGKAIFRKISLPTFMKFSYVLLLISGFTLLV